MPKMSVKNKTIDFPILVGRKRSRVKGRHRVLLVEIGMLCVPRVLRLGTGLKYVMGLYLYG